MIHNPVSPEWKEAHIKLIHRPGGLKRTGPIPALVTNGMSRRAGSEWLCMTHSQACLVARHREIKNAPPRTNLIPFDGKIARHTVPGGIWGGREELQMEKMVDWKSQEANLGTHIPST